MDQRKYEAHLSGEDIAFIVNVDTLDRACIIQKEALHRLCGRKENDSPFSPLEVFQAFEGRIKGVARRLVAAGVPGTPLVLTPNTFFGPPRIS